MNSKHVGIGLALAALLVTPVMAGEQSVTAESHSWNGYHWARTANPFTLKVGDNLSSVWKPYLSTTSSDWTASSVLNTTIVAGQAGTKRCAATTGRVEVCNSTYGNTGWLGVASVSITGGTHITSGTVKLNDTYFNTAQYNTPEWRNMVSCQEVGHTLGLDHQDTNFSNPNLNTCMDYTNLPSSNQHPNSHDYDELVTIYTHLDSSTTVGASTFGSLPPAMSQLDLAGIGQWGRLVALSADGHLSVHELDFGNGNKIVSYVIWTDQGPTGRQADPRDRQQK